MSVNLSNWVWKCSRSKGTARIVMLAIADTANDDTDGAIAFPRITTLAWKSNMSISAVHDALNTLADMGELRVIPNYKASPNGDLNGYQILMPDYGEPRPPVKRNRGKKKTKPGETTDSDDLTLLDETGPESDPTSTESAPPSDGHPPRTESGPVSTESGPVGRGRDLAPGGTESRPVRGRNPGLRGTESVPRTIKEPQGEPKNPASPDGAAPGDVFCGAGDGPKPGESAGSLARGWADEYARQSGGVAPSTAQIRKVATILRQELDRGVPYDIARRALWEWHKKGLGAPLLASEITRLLLGIANGGGNGHANGNGRFVPGTGAGAVVVPPQTAAEMII